MRQPTPIWSIIAICVTLILAGVAGLVTTNNKITRLEEEFQNLKDQQFQIQLNADKKFEKIDLKIDGIQADTRQILINLEKKQDRR